MGKEKEFLKIKTPVVLPDWKYEPEFFRTVFVGNEVVPIIDVSPDGDGGDVIVTDYTGDPIEIVNSDIVPVTSNDVYQVFQGDTFSAYHDFGGDSLRVDVYSDTTDINVQFKDADGVEMTAHIVPCAAYVIFDVEASEVRVQSREAGVSSNIQVIAWLQ